MAGNGDHDGCVSEASDIDFILTNTNRFYQDNVFAHRVHHSDRTTGCRRDAAKMTTTGQRSDEDFVIQCEPVHTDTVTQQCTTGSTLRGING